jgi:hypothetical protein
MLAPALKEIISSRHPNRPALPAQDDAGLELLLQCEEFSWPG